MEIRDLTVEITAKTPKIPCNWSSQANERCRSGKDVLNIGFLIGNFWPVALNKTHIVCTRIQAQLPEPSCIKDLIRGDFTPDHPLLVKMLHGWVFSQILH
jgi:hypothetical protein